MKHKVGCKCDLANLDEQIVPMLFQFNNKNLRGKVRQTEGDYILYPFVSGLELPND